MQTTSYQASFSSGEVSESIYARTDISKYSTALRRCRNFIIHPEGGVSNRPGFKYVASQKYADKMARMVSFIFSQDQAYALEFGNFYVRFYTDGLQIPADLVGAWDNITNYEADDFVTYGGVTYHAIFPGIDHQPDTSPAYWEAQTAYEVTTPYSETDLRDLRFESSADVLYILHPDHQTRTLNRFGNADWTLELFVPDDGPFMPENIIDTFTLTASALTGAITLTSSVALFDPLHVGGLFNLSHYIEGQNVTTSFSSATTSTAIKCFTTWRVISHGTWTGRFNVEKSTDNGATWTVLRTFSGAGDFNANTSGTEDPETNTEPFLIRINMASYTSGTANIDLSSDPFNQEGVVRITAYLSPTTASATVLKDIGLTTATEVWSEGSWSNLRGWPQQAAFHQDRLVFAATYAEPQTIWASQTANYTSFRRNNPLLDTDGITVRLPGRQLNAINGLVALGDIIPFTIASEWRFGSSNDAFTPSTIFTKIQGYRGSFGVVPVIIGNRIIYVQKSGQVIRDFAFDFESDGFDGANLSILFRHRFEHHSILELAYQQDPDSIVWCLREDGVLMALTYMQEQEVLGWAWHDTEGEIESVCVIPATGYDEMWIAVKRGDKRFIERMTQRMVSEDVQDQFFVDSGVTYDVPLTITGISSGNPIVITSTAHGLINGDYIDLSDILGMESLNGNRYRVANVTANTFSLQDEAGVDVSGVGLTYISGGYVRKAVLTFSGLDHLEGLSISILANGEVQPQQVVSGGSITLNRRFSRVHAGLQYFSDIETLNVEIGLRSGTLQGKPVKIGNVTFRLLKSRGGWIGPNENTLHEAFTPQRLSLGKAPALFSGDVRQALGAGYETGGRVFYRQKDPLPITVNSIMPEVGAAD